LNASPLSVAENFAHAFLPRRLCAVFTSATLSTEGGLDYFRSRLGLPDEAQTGVFPSPFDTRHRTLLYIPRYHPEPSQPSFCEKSAVEIERLLALTGGAALVLFTSYANLAVKEFAGRGFRSLGVARADQEGQWQFVGVLPLFDPPRAEAKATIATARQMGVTVKMVTGDALAIAVETAKTLGMGANILVASGFGDAKDQASATLVKSIESADGFAQVFPEHKFHIVDVLQKRGHIVGMTGDGVNDAPALKKADCGIAVSGATDAARAAAAIVLMTSGLSVIIDAIKESRKIFQRMNSYATYRIAETIRVLLFMTLSILVFNFYPAMLQRYHRSRLQIMMVQAYQR